MIRFGVRLSSIFQPCSIGFSDIAPSGKIQQLGVIEDAEFLTNFKTTHHGGPYSLSPLRSWAGAPSTGRILPSPMSFKAEHEVFAETFFS